MSKEDVSDVSLVVDFIQRMFKRAHRHKISCIIIFYKLHCRSFDVWFTTKDCWQTSWQITPIPSYEDLLTKLLVMIGGDLDKKDLPQVGKVGFFGQEGDSELLMLDDGSSNDPEVVAARERKFSFVGHYIPPAVDGAYGSFCFHSVDKQQ